MLKVILTILLSTILSAEIYDGVAVVVKDKAITLLDIKDKMADDRVDQKTALDMLIREKLEEIEIDKRKIVVSNSEIYDEIQTMARRNHMSISDLYDAVRDARGTTSTELKAKVKKRLQLKKLYKDITMGALSEPSEYDIEQYYNLHKDSYKHPSAFKVIIYDSANKMLLQVEVDNPMFFSPEIATNEQTLPYARISPELASLLEKTPLNGFTPVIPNGKGGFMSFYIKEIKSAKEGGLESVRGEIINSIMEEKREIVLKDYFARLRDNININIIRVPK